MEFNEFKLAVKKVALNLDINEYDLYYSLEKQLEYTAYNGKIDKFNGSKSIGVCFRCLIDGKMGYSSTEFLSKEEAENIVKKAVQSAKEIDSKDVDFIYENNFENTIDSSSFDYEKLIIERANSMKNSDIIPSDIAGAALNLEKLILKNDSKIKKVSECTAMYFENEISLCVQGNSNLDKSFKNRFSAIACEPIIEDKGINYSSFELLIANRFKDLDLEKLALLAIEKTNATLNTKKIESGNYKAVFSNKAMAKMLEAFSGIFSSENAQQNLSLLKGKENEKIAADILTIVDDPYSKEAFVIAPFDAQGVKTYKKNVVEKGILKTLLYNLKTASKENKTTTANAFKSSFSSDVGISPFNFYIKPGIKSKDSALNEINDGIIITEIKGIHAGVNAVSGDFSLESSGFLIKNGVEDVAINQFIVSGNFFNLLNNISIVCDDLYFQMPSYPCSGSFGSPSVYVGEISVAG